LQEISVTQEGNIRIDPIKDFDHAGTCSPFLGCYFANTLRLKGLHPAMRENVRLAGYTVPTPIQQYVLPAIFKGHDVVACAQTGS
jgi:ATP-dependent RNA helicase DDX3X